MFGWTVKRNALGVRPGALVLSVTTTLVTYYVVPVRRDSTLTGRVIGTVLVGALLATVIIRELRQRDNRVGRLLTLMVVCIAAIALAFYAVSRSPNQFEGLHTRTDALYFTVTTLTTIGYGDIHPVGQLARVLIIATVAFNVVFIAALVSAISSSLHSRREDRQ